MKDGRKTMAVYPGSFDPITNGHLDIIARGLTVFDEVVIAILVNPDKEPLFSVEERYDIIRETYAGDARVRVDTFSGLLVDYAEKVGASVIVRGLRAISDFEYEFQMALMNRRLSDEIETVFLMPSETYTYVNASLVKEIARYGGAIEGLVPPNVAPLLRKRLGVKR